MPFVDRDHNVKQPVNLDSNLRVVQAANVLLSSAEQDRRGFVAKVSDFGLSRVLGGNKNHIKTQTFGTVTHMPPELLSKGGRLECDSAKRTTAAAIELQVQDAMQMHFHLIHQCKPS